MSGATNKITALYCRLSQEDARLGESLSIENQKVILLEYAKKNHFPNPVFFVDDGYSGTNYDRPGFQSMLVEIEAGRVGIVITKDLSRLGRNSALTGLYTNFTFPQYGVRYIAINDNYDTIDPNSVNNDFAGIKNWFNEFYARDTSRKIRAVQKAKGERGVPLTVNVPYGYVKDPENPKHWLVDPEAAAIVKRIFSMCMEGRGPTQIANQLWADKVLTPTAYKLSHGRSTNAPAPEDPYRWDKRAVSLILERREYTGCTVNFKTYTNSIWDKKRHLNPVENQAIFPDTHERIIDDDVFEKVQEIRSQRHRMTRTGKSSIFSGMVYCADCGSKMQYGSSNNRDFSQDFFDCSLHKKNGSKCKGYRCTCTVGRSRYSLFDFSYENLTNYRPVAVTCNSYAECKDCKIGGFCGGGCQLSHQIDFKKCCTYEEEVFSHFMKTLFIPYIKSKYNEVNQNERKAENRCT